MPENLGPGNSPEKPESFRSGEVIEYSEGVGGLKFTEVGDVIRWDKHKYSDPYAPDTRVVVSTKSGNFYVLGAGVVVNTETRGAYDLFQQSEPLGDIVIGKPWVTSKFNTSDVEGVELSYYKATVHPSARYIDKPSPFIAADKWVRAASSRFGRPLA